MDYSLMFYLNRIYFSYVSKLFEGISNINYAYIKGESLSLLAYNGLNMRKNGDIDILLDRKNIHFTELELIKHSFSNYENAVPREVRVMLMSQSHQMLPWAKEINPWGIIQIDLNFDIFWGEYEGKSVDIEDFLSDTVEIEIYGVKVKTLTPIKTMIQLILHHYKDMNSIYLLATRKSIKYDMFKDVYYLLKNNLDAIPLDKLYAMSVEYEIIPFVFYVFYYTGQVFDDEVLKRYTEAFRVPEGEALLNCYGLCTKERKEWKFDFKTRLESENLYELIKDDLTDKDREKIAVNKRVFMGVSE